MLLQAHKKVRNPGGAIVPQCSVATSGEYFELDFVDTYRDPAIFERLCRIKRAEESISGVILYTKGEKLSSGTNKRLATGRPVAQ